VRHESGELLVEVAAPAMRSLASPANIVLAIGCIAIVLPTMIEVAQVSWSTEQGGHGPLVLATGSWLVWRELSNSKVVARPGKLLLGLALLAPVMIVFMLARITGVLEIEAFAMYGSLIVAAYLLFGGAVIR